MQAKLRIKKASHHYKMVQMPSFFTPEGDFRLAFEHDSSSDAVELMMKPDDVVRLVKVATALPEDFPDRIEVKSGKVSDGSHSFDELYEARCILTAALFDAYLRMGIRPVKSWRHSDGELCFGGGWFIVQAELPTGQVSFHYPEKDWGRFNCQGVERGLQWDGHTTQDVYDRLLGAISMGNALERETPPLEKDDALLGSQSCSIEERLDFYANFISDKGLSEEFITAWQAEHP